MMPFDGISQRTKVDRWMEVLGILDLKVGGHCESISSIFAAERLSGMETLYDLLEVDPKEKKKVEFRIKG